MEETAVIRLGMEHFMQKSRICKLWLPTSSPVERSSIQDLTQ